MSVYDAERAEEAHEELRAMRRAEEEEQEREWYGRQEEEHWIEVCAAEGHLIFEGPTGISDRCRCGIVSLYDVLARPDLFGTCGRCQRVVDNRDPQHRVTSIVEGGRGVECELRGDFRWNRSR